jgi:hypothetical protein
MDTADVAWAVILLVAIPLLGIATAPWLMSDATRPRPERASPGGGAEIRKDR